MDVLRDGWECSPVIDEEGIGPGDRNPVQFSNRADLHPSDNRSENTRKKEIVVWILLAVLGVVSVTAIYLLGLKIGGN